MAQSQIDNLDKKILNLVANDARKPFLEVARDCNVSGAAIHQRIQKLTKAGIIRGSEFILDSEKIGYETCAYMGIYLKNPEDQTKVIEELKKIPEIVECHYTDKTYDLFVKIYAKNNRHLLSIIHDKLQTIGMLARTETMISLKEVFRRNLPIDDAKE